MRGVVGPAPSKWRARWLFELRGTFLREDGKKLTQGEFADRLVQDGIDLGSTEGAKYPAETLRIRYGRWEKGTEDVPAGLIEAIAAKYDRELPQPPPAPQSDTERLLEAMAAQTAAITELAAQMRRLADGQAGTAKALGQIAGKALGLPDPAETPSETQPRQQRRGRRPAKARP